MEKVFVNGKILYNRRQTRKKENMEDTILYDISLLLTFFP